MSQDRKTQASTARDEAAERVERSKRLVLNATRELLTETGLGGISVDDVAKRSGVAKTTIYRHWPSGPALFLDACAQLGTKPASPDTGDLRTDLAVLVGQMAASLAASGWAAALPSIVDAAQRDAELARLHARLHAQFVAALQDVIARGQQTHELSDVHTPPELVSQIVGPLFYRRWFSREPLDRRFIEGLIERFLAGTRVRPAERRR